MGCSSSKFKSKLQDEGTTYGYGYGYGPSSSSSSPAVALCRERCGLLELAVRQRYTFAHSHAAYLHSLDSFALSLHRFSILNLPPSNSNSESDSDSDSSPRLHGHAARRLSALPPSSHDHRLNPPTRASTTSSNNQIRDHNALSNTSNSDHNFVSTNNNSTNNSGASGPIGGLLMINTNSALPTAPSSTSNAPPPPPPPRNLTLDFLNPFDTATVGSFYPAGHDSTDVRRAEGIPDLEDDAAVLNEIHIDQGFLGGVNATSGIRQKPSVADHDALNAREKRIKGGGNATGGTSLKGGEPEVVREIQLQFERASDSGSELAKFLEVGKVPYNGKSRTTRAVAVASEILLHLPLPSLCKGTDPTVVDLDEDSELTSINLSSTLHKLRLWENKLYKEVKVEEEMRVLHERKSKGLKHLDESGAENPKVDATRTLVRSLSTKIKIAMQVVDKISVRINELRDEELWPQLHELIHGFTRMWKSMAECHGNQCRAIREARQYLDGIAFRKQHQFGDAHCEAIWHLERDLITWTLSFSYWVVAQKDYARALNNWLMKCVGYVPEEEEETADGIPPYSPGRMGAPTVFVVCNEWSESMSRISEKEVMDSMREFASHVLQLWEQHRAEMMSSRKKDNKSREKELDDRIRKEINALDKRMMLLMMPATAAAAGGGREDAVHTMYSELGHGRGTTTLQTSLQRVIEAMEKFAGSSLKIYEELLKLIDELG